MSRYLNSIIFAIKTSVLVPIVPILFIVLLFIGCKFYKKGEWNDEYLSLKQTQIIKGFCAVGIILHHCSQRTAASWLKSKYIIHGLDFFVDIGYLFVALFLFFSGYGLYKSYKQKQDYFRDYFSKRILPILIAYLTTSLIYYLYKQVSSTYTWYIVAILVCYILFYFAFKYIKKEFISYLIVLLGITIYSIICDFFMLGGWWYNTIGIFFIGLVFAKYEKNIINVIKKVYLPSLLVAIIATIVCRYYGRYYENELYSIVKESTYFWHSLYVILYRFAAGVCFTLLIILISLKCKFNSKVLEFYGNISLEFYLIQGLFVQTFSFSYFDMVKPLYYIKNVPIYTIICIVCSTGVGFLLHYIDGKIRDFLIYFAETRRLEINYVKKYMKYTLLVLVSAIVLYIVGMMFVSNIENKNAEEDINKYTERYISFANVDGKKMAAYITGSGENTLVLMRGNNDPCPTLSMRYLADKLAQEYKVVVLDYLGTGFSDKPSRSRTSSNIAYEIHEALHDFGIEDNYILVPEYVSGYYAQEYVRKYKDEVKAVIGLQADNNYEFKAMMDDAGANILEYNKYLKNEAIMNYIKARLANIKGIDLLLWRVLEPDYARSIGKENMPVAKTIFFKNIYNSTYVDEINNYYENYRKSYSGQYPRKMYVVDIINYGNSQNISALGLNSEEVHARSCFDRSKHKAFIINDIYYAVFIGPGVISKTMAKAIEFIK